VVVVVGGRVVVVVGGSVVVVGAVDPGEALGVVVVGGAVVVVVVVEAVVGAAGTAAGAVLDPLAPGCSFATTTPMATVAPVAARTAERVRNRRWERARCRVSGECDRRGEFIGDLGSALMHGSSCAYRLPGIGLWNICETRRDRRQQRHMGPRPWTHAAPRVM
jgi:hypothetical protein